METLAVSPAATTYASSSLANTEEISGKDYPSSRPYLVHSPISSSSPPHAEKSSWSFQSSSMNFVEGSPKDIHVSSQFSPRSKIPSEEVSFKIPRSEVERDLPEVSPPLRRAYTKGGLSGQQNLSPLKEINSVERPKTEPVFLDIHNEQIKINKSVETLFISYFQGQLSLDRILIYINDWCCQPPHNIYYRTLLVFLRQIFYSMYDYPQYASVALLQTAQLIGRIVCLPKLCEKEPLSILMALRCVIEALRQGVKSPMFAFGVFALEEFLEELPRFPQFIVAMNDIVDLQDALPEFIFYGKSILDNLPSTLKEAYIVNPEALKDLYFPLPPSKRWALPLNDISPSVRNSHSLVLFPSSSSSSSADPNLMPLSPTSAEFVASSPSMEASLFIQELQRQLSIPSLYRSFADRICILLEEIDLFNFCDKAVQLRSFLLPEHHRWLAHCIVLSFVCRTRCVHGPLLNLVAALLQPELMDAVVEVTYESLQALLRMPMASDHPTLAGYIYLMETLGSWLGFITLGRNKPLKSKHLDIKALLLEAYEKNSLRWSVPLVCSILEGVQLSKNFKPPNPWTTAILNVLSEIHSLYTIDASIQHCIEKCFMELKLEVSMFQGQTHHLLKRKPTERGEALPSAASLYRPPPTTDTPPPFPNGTALPYVTLSEGVPTWLPSDPDTAAFPLLTEEGDRSGLSQEGPWMTGKDPKPPMLPSSLLREKTCYDSSVPSFPSLLDAKEEESAPRGGTSFSFSSCRMVTEPSSHSPSFLLETQREQQETIFSLQNEKKVTPLVGTAVAIPSPLPYRTVGSPSLPVVASSPSHWEATAISTPSQDPLLLPIEGAAPSVHEFNMTALVAHMRESLLLDPTLELVHTWPLLRGMVACAMTLAFEDIYSNLGKEYATIACRTTCALILKDFCDDKMDISLLHTVASFMVTGLCGSLVLVSCPRPLGDAFYSHLMTTLFGSFFSVYNSSSMNPQVFPFSEGFTLQVKRNISKIVSDNISFLETVLVYAVILKATRDIDAALSEGIALHSTPINPTRVEEGSSSMAKMRLRRHLCSKSPSESISKRLVQLYQRFEGPGMLNISFRYTNTLEFHRKQYYLEEGGQTDAFWCIPPFTDIEFAHTTRSTDTALPLPLTDPWQSSGNSGEDEAHRGGYLTYYRGHPFPPLPLMASSMDPASFLTAFSVLKNPLYLPLSPSPPTQSDSFIQLLETMPLLFTTTGMRFSLEFPLCTTTALQTDGLYVGSTKDPHMHLACIDFLFKALVTQAYTLLVFPPFTAMTLHTQYHSLVVRVEQQKSLPDMHFSSLFILGSLPFTHPIFITLRCIITLMYSGNPHYYKETLRAIARKLFHLIRATTSHSSSIFSSQRSSVFSVNLPDICMELFGGVLELLCTLLPEIKEELIEKFRSLPQLDENLFLFLRYNLLSPALVDTLLSEHLTEDAHGHVAQLDFCIHCAYILHHKKLVPLSSLPKTIHRLQGLTLPQQQHSFPSLATPSEPTYGTLEEMKLRGLEKVRRYLVDGEYPPLDLLTFVSLPTVTHLLRSYMEFHHFLGAHPTHIWKSGLYRHAYAPLYLQPVQNERLETIGNLCKSIVQLIFETWLSIVNLSATQNPSLSYHEDQKFIFLRGFIDLYYPSFLENAEWFFTICLEEALSHAVWNAETFPNPPASPSSLSGMETVSLETSGCGEVASMLYVQPLDAFAKLLVHVLVLNAHCNLQTRSTTLLHIGMAALLRPLQGASQKLQKTMYQRSYFRILITLLKELHAAASHLMREEKDAADVPIEWFVCYAHLLKALTPMVFPCFTFSWITLVSHSLFYPTLLRHEAGWDIFKTLLLELFKMIRLIHTPCKTSNSFVCISLDGSPHPMDGFYGLHALQKRMYSFIVQLRKEFPEFLCCSLRAFCDILPLQCVQLRNSLLSVCPVYLCPLENTFMDISNFEAVKRSGINGEEPRILYTMEDIVRFAPFKSLIDDFVYNERDEISQLQLELLHPCNRQQNCPRECLKYDFTACNAVVRYIALLQPTLLTDFSQPSSITPTIKLFQRLVYAIDEDGMYFLISSLVDHLTYPTTHTYFYSHLLLWLFYESTDVLPREQIAAVLLERLITFSPHPWGLKVTFIELTQNPRYNFWKCPLVHENLCMQRLFKLISQKCIQSFSLEFQNV
ncbi:hypothetical protein IE077_001998 [Cardiosporidium cionae]|uniref:Uncharacterized protein n=1 Tax=Cardiosporidium cionae TaxID=476202 RepID=A0ABQ7JBT3_9APIC|nr:hypothetical protein IE077_001998 [Cardiosporidium cionae]|eukprot:KAF8821465.1 hypothetical protein IE077_001998 [Cardiosporidium cionae]